LEDVHHLGDRCCLVGTVEIGEDRQVVFVLHPLEDFEATFHPGTPIRVYRTPIRLVERALEDQIDLVAFGDAFQRPRHSECMIL
jgi:hypothetical protein